MNYNIFTSNQSLGDLASIQTPKNTAAIRNDAFATKTSTQSTSDNDSFARMMERIKNKTNEEQQKQQNAAQHAHTAHSKSNAQTRETQSNDIQSRGFDNAQSLLSSLLTPVTEETSVKENPTDALDGVDIVSLIDELTKLIEDTANENEEPTTLTSSLEDIINSDETPKRENLLNILSAILSDQSNETGENDLKGQNQSFFDMLDAIQTALNSDTGYKLLSNLTPEELNALDEGIQLYIDGELSAEDEQALEEVIAQFVALIPPQDNKDYKAPAPGTETDIALTSDTAKAQPTDEKHYTQSRYDARYDGQSQTAHADAQSKSDFKATLKDSAQNAHASIPQTANDNTKSAGQKFLQSGILPDATLPALDSPLTTNGIGINAQSVTQQSGQSALATTITQGQSPAHASTATQLVSATIQKAIKDGDTTKIKLDLDPPELGRVEVKMSIDKDSKAKIVLTAEKPETFMMLQKDSDVLHKAMSDAGLDMDGGSDLSFELASDNRDFNNPNGQNGRGNASGKNSDGFAEGETIATTMDWHVDPDTGRMRYNTVV